MFSGFEFRAHDPTLWGWAVVAVYLVGAAVSIGAGLARRRGATGGSLRLEWFWYGCAAALVALAINKQLDLHGYAESFVERQAWLDGWYYERQAVQQLFIRVVALGGAIIALLLFFYFRRGTPAHWVAIAGLIGLEAFIAIRAASLHDVDALLRRSVVTDLRLSHALEIGGALVVAGAALAAALVSLGLRHRTPSRSARPASEGHTAGVSD
jgi:hypothetical protein